MVELAWGGSATEVVNPSSLKLIKNKLNIYILVMINQRKCFNNCNLFPIKFAKKGVLLENPLRF